LRFSIINGKVYAGLTGAKQAMLILQLKGGNNEQDAGK
jgi:hypothetical protein